MPCLLAGLCLTSMCLSLVCLAHLLLMEQPSCECKAMSENPTQQQNMDKISHAIDEQEDGNHIRTRRNAPMSSNNLYQLQTQIMMIETR